MSSYSYTQLESGSGLEIPPVPLIEVEVSIPGTQPAETITRTAFLDTGADCSLVPFDILARVRATRAGSAERISGTGRGNVLVVPYLVGLRFDRYFSPFVRVRGCASEEIQGILLIGRDLLNKYRIEFNGLELTVTIH